MPTLMLIKLIKFGDDALVIKIPKALARCCCLAVGSKLQLLATISLVIKPQQISKSGRR